MKWEVRTMQFETSYFDRTLFKKNFTRFWPIWASYLVIWLFALPINALTSFSGTNNGYYSAMASSASAHIWFALVYGLFAAMAVLSHLYASRSANFYGTLPVRREGIFLTQYLSGFAFVALPQLVVAAFMAVIGFAWGAAPILPCLAWLGVGMGMMFFFYTFAFLCGVFTGHILALPAFYVILNCLAYMVYDLISAVMERTFWGFAGFGNTVDSLVEWLTPVLPLSNIRFQYSDKVGNTIAGGEYLLVYCAVALVLLVCAFFLYKHRKLESAGDVVSYRFVRPVFKYGVAVCTGLFLGYLTSEIIGEPTLPIMAVIWTVLGCFAAQMLLDKTFRVFKKWKGVLAVGVVMAAAMACVTFDLMGFESWIPEVEDVKSVDVLQFYANVGWNSGNDGRFTATDPRTIQDIITIHKNAIAYGNGEFAPGDYSKEGSINIEVVYHTKTGDHTRQYFYTFAMPEADVPGTTANALQDIVNNRELYWEIYGFAQLERQLAAGAMLREVDYSYENFDGYNNEDDFELGYMAPSETGKETYFFGSDALELLNAVKTDFFAGRIGVIDFNNKLEREDCYRMLRFYCSDELILGDENSSSYSFYSTDTQLYSTYISISVMPESTLTLETLERLFPNATMAEDLWTK